MTLKDVWAMGEHYLLSEYKTASLENHCDVPSYNMVAASIDSRQAVCKTQEAASIFSQWTFVL